MNRRLFARAALITSALVSAAAPALAQSYPTKPVTVIVPFAAGGGSDNIARPVVAKLGERSGKTFIIDNRGGAGTNIGNELAARATPDGYTLLLGQITLSINPYLYPNLKYNPEKSFVPVAHIATAPTVLIVPASSPFKNVNDLIAAAKASPGKLNFASGGAGTSVHLGGELFKLLTKTSMTHVPYKGSAPAVTDLIGGQVDMIFDTASSALPHVKGGKVRALAVTGSTRLPDLPNVPTFTEQGLKDFDVPVWYGILAPAGTPAPVVQWLNAELNTVLKDPAVTERLLAIGAVPVGGTPAQMGEFMKVQAERWAKVVKDGNVKVD